MSIRVPPQKLDADTGAWAKAEAMLIGNRAFFARCKNSPILCHKFSTLAEREAFLRDNLHWYAVEINGSVFDAKRKP